MKLNDAQTLRQFVRSERRWLDTLHQLQKDHYIQLGKKVTPVEWLPGGEFGKLSWLGYYWSYEMFWFGYGLYQGVWRPLIEADSRSRFSGVLEKLQTELSGTWEFVTAEKNLYRRLWSDENVAGSSDAEFGWFRARSRELHEFVVQPTQAD